jgi:hypothetical protein
LPAAAIGQTVGWRRMLEQLNGRAASNSKHMLLLFLLLLLLQL